MANQLLTIDMITAEAVRMFKNSNLFIMNMDTQYDPAFAIDGAKIGNTLRIRLPNDYTVNDGPAMQLQDTNEIYTTLTVSSQKNVAMPFTSAEKTMSLDNFNEIVLQPAMNALVGKVAVDIMSGVEGGVCNFISNTDAGGNIITPTQETFVTANAILDNNGADMMNRRIAVSPTTDARTTAGLSGLLNPTPEISAQFRTGMMKSGLGYERWFRDQTVIRHTSGTFTAGTVNGGSQTTGSEGGTITVNAITGTLKKGDFITIAGVNMVNRTNKQDQGTLEQFVLTADAANAATSLSIYPGIVPPVGGNDVQYQTVTASPANGAAITLLTLPSEVYQKSVAYTQKAVTMATADLVMPTKAVEAAARAVYDGISLRILTDYLTGSDQLATRVDVLFGKKYIRPQWLCVVADRT